MSYLRVATNQSKTGLKWLVLMVSKVTNGKKTEKKLTPTVFRDLGFSDNMSALEAREHAKKLNALEKIKRKEQAAKVKASERLHDLAIVEGSLISKEQSDLFVTYMQENWQGGEYNLKKHIQHWVKVQKLITDLKLQPSQYFKQKKSIYNWFRKQQISVSYIEKLLKVLNMWGEFYAEESKSYFKKVPSPRGLILENIKEASNADGNGSAPMTRKILMKLSDKLPEGQYEYLHACLWLGLRPSELDRIIENEDKYFQMKAHKHPVNSEIIKVAGIYQPKLTGVSKDSRWKWIPCFHPEQVAALNNIATVEFKKPILKTIRKYSGVDTLGLYSGRKGFTDLMLDLGQSLENISQWLGHASIERTWKHYKDKNKITFNNIPEAENE